jgi:hypothetical protein
MRPKKLIFIASGVVCAAVALFGVINIVDAMAPSRCFKPPTHGADNIVTIIVEVLTNLPCLMAGFDWIRGAFGAALILVAMFVGGVILDFANRPDKTKT